MWEIGTLGNVTKWQVLFSKSIHPLGKNVERGWSPPYVYHVLLLIKSLKSSPSLVPQDIIKNIGYRDPGNSYLIQNDHHLALY